MGKRLRIDVDETGGGCAVRRARLQELNRGEIGVSVRPLTADGREGSIEEDGIGDAPGTEDALAVRHGDGGAEISSGGRVDRAFGTDDFLHERGLVDEIKVTGAAGDAPGWMLSLIHI